MRACDHSYACVYTWGLGTPTMSQHISDSEKLAQVFSCAPDVVRIQVTDIIEQNLELYQLSHPITPKVWPFIYERGKANQSTQRNTQKACPKISITYLELKIYCVPLMRFEPPPSNIGDDKFTWSEDSATCHPNDETACLPSTQ